MTALTIAITRWRVCRCTGNSNVLVSRFSSCLTLMACLMFQVSSVIGTLLFTADNTNKESSHATLCGSRVTGNGVEYFLLVAIVSTKMVPSICVFISYGFIHRLVHIHANTLQNNIPTFPDNDSTRISMVTKKSTASTSIKNPRHIFNSLYLIVGVYFLTITPYLTFTIYSVLYDMSQDEVYNTWFVFSKIFMCLLHPLGEGIFQEEKRQRLAFFFRKMMNTCCKRPSTVEVMRNTNSDILVACSGNQSRDIHKFAFPTLLENSACNMSNNDSVIRSDINGILQEQFRSIVLVPPIATNTPNTRVNPMGSTCTISTISQDMVLPSMRRVAKSEFQSDLDLLACILPDSRKPCLRRSNSSPGNMSQSRISKAKKLLKNSSNKTDILRIINAITELEDEEYREAQKSAQNQQTHDSLALPVFHVRPPSQFSLSTMTLSRPTSSSSSLFRSAGSVSVRGSSAGKMRSRDSIASSQISKYSNDTASNWSLQRIFHKRHRKTSVSSRVPSLLSCGSRNSGYILSTVLNDEIPEHDTLSIVSKHF